MASPWDAALLDALDRHARRRQEGIATVSVLVGEPERAWAVWMAWLHRRGLRAVTPEPREAREMLCAWATVLVRGRDLIADVERFVHRCQPEGARRELRFQGKTVHERRVLLEGLSPPASAAGTWALCRQLLETTPRTPSEALPAPVRDAIAHEPGAALQALLALVPAVEAPALGVAVGAEAAPGLRTVTTLCGADPSLTAACVLSPDAFAEHLRRGESRARTLLREGRLDVEALPQQGRDRARSEPEWFLYQLLHHRPSTAGLFVLNDWVEGSEGERPWQVDLLCRELKLAVEIDGYFHFRDASAFRRDRRKDVALQRAGYLVLRVLADDVAPRLEEILERIDTLITAQRRKATGKESTHGEQ